MEFQFGHARLDAGDIAHERFQRVVVVFAPRERKELARIAKAHVDRLQRRDGRIERASFLAEILGALGVVPDAGVLEGARNFYEPRLLRVVVKDTSAAP